MESLEVQAKTVEEAVQRALEQLGVSREEVEVTVVREGKSGLLNFGAEDAIVRVTPLEKQPVDETPAQVGEIVEKLLSLMGIESSVEVQTGTPAIGEEDSPPPVDVNIIGDDLGILIGRRGQTLASLQYIVRLIIGHQTDTWLPITVDVESYKQRRNEGLQSFALQMAEQVKERATPFSLEPMPAYERRMVHLVLADHPDVVTESIGQGESRRVVIMPKGSSLS